jgi:magnesium transporter
VIATFSAKSGKLTRGGADILSPDALWIDLLAPTPEEEKAVESLTGITVPTREKMQEIEASSRLARVGDVLYLISPVLTNSTGFNPENISLTFVLTPRHLITVRHATPQAVAGFAARLERQHPAPASAGDLMLSLIEALVDRMADVLERIALELDGISHRIFHQPTPLRHKKRASSRDLEAMLRSIGRGGDLQSKSRDTILGLRRLAAYLTASSDLLGGKEASGRVKTITRDLQSLSEYADFLNNKIGFLLDATLGMISIQQNNIIKLFSVVAVLFLPPTLVASIYGMNFHFMPELDKAWGYPFALVMMVAAAVLPYWIFKRKGWL